MPRYIQWKQCPTLKYEILFLDMVCWLQFRTQMTLPKATNLHLYFKENVEHFLYSFMFLNFLDHKQDVFRLSFCVPSNANARNIGNNRWWWSHKRLHQRRRHDRNRILALGSCLLRQDLHWQVKGDKRMRTELHDSMVQRKPLLVFKYQLGRLDVCQRIRIILYDLDYLQYNWNTSFFDFMLLISSIPLFL